MKLPRPFSDLRAAVTINTAFMLCVLASPSATHAQHRTPPVTPLSVQQPTPQSSVEARTTLLPVVVIQNVTDEPTILIVATPTGSGLGASSEPSLCEPGDVQVWDPAARIYRLCNQRSLSTSCVENSLQYFDASESIWRPCPAQPSVRGAVRGAGARCVGDSLQYFDEAEQIYRPCPGSHFTVSTVAREAPVDRCRPEDVQYFDSREQIYRPCPVRANRPRPTPVITPVSRSRTRPGRGDCPAGMLQYYDRTLRLFRPCPEPVNAATNSPRAEQNQ